MKFARFTVGADEKIYAGVVTEEGIKEITGDIFSKWEYTGKVYEEQAVRFASPLAPNQIIGIGANFVADTSELPESLPEIPVFFFKPTSSVVGPEENIIIPDKIDEVKFESEIAVVIGKKMKNVPVSDVFEYVFGYTVVNDVTAPQFFHENGHWTVGKSFDTFTPLGPVIETEFDPSEATVQAFLNGEKKQDSPTELMIVPIANMISYLSNVMTLNPGDVILTGSPLGAVFLKNGDTIECTINGIGTLKNPVKK